VTVKILEHSCENTSPNGYDWFRRNRGRFYWSRDRCNLTNSFNKNKKGYCDIKHDGTVRGEGGVMRPPPLSEKRIGLRMRGEWAWGD
jgi:hypothetical protein